MQDQLEKIIQENRSAFDDRLPADDLWSKIEGNIHPSQDSGSGKWGFLAVMKVAAAVILLVGFGAWGGMYFANSQGGGSGVFAQDAAYQEFTEAEALFVKQINQRKGELQTIEGTDLLEKDLSELETHFNELKTELGNVGNREMILNAMIQNYRTRIELMEFVLKKHAEAAKNL